MKTLGCVPGAAVILLVAGCGPTPREFHQYGLSHFHSGSYVEAIAMFNAALEAGPERPDTLYYLGECYRSLARRKAAAGETPSAMRNLDQALLLYTQAIEAHPGHAPAIRAKSDALELKGQYEEALAVAAWAGENLGDVARGARHYVNWARRLEAQHDYDAAKLRYEQAIAVEPKSAWVHAQLGAFYQRLGDEERATAAYREAYRLNPTEPGVARALHALGAYPAKPVTASASESDQALE